MDLFLGQAMEGRVQKKKRESGEWLAVDAETKPLLELQTREMEMPTLYFVSSNLTLHFIAFSVLFFVERVKFALDIVVLYCSFATVCFPTSLVSGLKPITSKHLALASQRIFTYEPQFIHLHLQAFPSRVSFNLLKEVLGSTAHSKASMWENELLDVGYQPLCIRIPYKLNFD
ncbi:hypothetical protein V8G54_011237 [Vigna mungo]|uniref:Uncharacterized protein n=1 Tax=Vigna mungo TaxID=3915 RepID=A0AAQ3NRL7_VIGMU